MIHDKTKQNVRGEKARRKIEDPPPKKKKKRPHISPSGRMEPCAFIWWLAISAPHNTHFSSHLQNPKLKTKAETCNSNIVYHY